MKKNQSFFILTVFLSLIISNISKAAFPDDFEGVVFDEEVFLPGLTNVMKGMRQTANMTIYIGGVHPYQNSQNVVLTSSKKDVWRTGTGDLICCNVNAWIFIKVGDTWHANTWEYMRKGQTTKSSAALVGPGHIRGPLFNGFRPKNGEVYGFMVSGTVRAGLHRLNVNERSNIAFFRYGVGPVSNDEIRGNGGEKPVNITPTVNLLLED